MTQYALPDGDSEVFNWAQAAGDGDGDTFDELDEGFGAGRGSGSGPDDATTYWETTNEVTNGLRTRLETVTDPETSDGHIYRTRNCKDSSGGRQLDVETRFYGPLLVNTEDFPNIDEVWTTRGDTLTAAEANALTDYSLLLIRTQILETGGGSPREGYESAHEFECPDAGPPVSRRIFIT